MFDHVCVVALLSCVTVICYDSCTLHILRLFVVLLLVSLKYVSQRVAVSLLYVTAGHSIASVCVCDGLHVISVSIPGRVFLFPGIREWQFSFTGFQGARE